MRKIVLAFVLMVGMSAGAFAHHPDGWGIGGGFQFGHNWDDHIRRNRANSSLTLFLKTPTIPIYWGISASILDWEFSNNRTRFGFRVTGDYYVIARSIIPEIGLGWFLGIGGYFSYDRRTWPGNNNYFNLLDFGARFPVGLSWIPLDFLEVFGAIAPSVGFYWHNRGWTSDRTGLGGALQGDLGVRFWL